MLRVITMDTEPVLFPIGTICDATGLSARQVRYLEQIGLLAPMRRGGRRYYAETDLKRAGLIKRWRDHGYSLQRIRSLLETTPATPRPGRDTDRPHFEDVKFFFRDGSS